MASGQALSTLEKLPEGLPKKWRPKYLLKRIGEEDIVIPWETRNMIIRALADGKRFVQIGEFTIMLNSIKSVDPYWSEHNIPPKPKFPLDALFEDTETNREKIQKAEAENAEWEKFFGERVKQIKASEWSEK